MEFDKDEYTTKEAAEILGISEFTLRRKIRNKEINVIGKKGKTYIISKEELEKYAKKKGSFNILGNSTLLKGVSMLLSNKNMNTIASNIGRNSISIGKQFSDLENILEVVLPIEKIKKMFNIKTVEQSIEFYKNLSKSEQKKLNIVKLELAKLILGKNDTKEYKEKELNLRIQIETIERNLQIIKMMIDRIIK